MRSAALIRLTGPCESVDGAVEGLAHAVEQFFLGHQHLQGR